MKTNKTAMHAIRTINEGTAQVTKDFAKKAVIFGTAEFYAWVEYRKFYPDAKMVTKTIRKNANKQVDTRHMTYKNMALYISEQKNAKVLMVEFKHQVAISKIQTNPYRCVLAWFIKTFEGYDDYKTFFARKAKEAAEEKSMFQVVKSSAIIVDDDEAVGQ